MTDMLRLLKTSRPGRPVTLKAPRGPRCPGTLAGAEGAGDAPEERQLLFCALEGVRAEFEDCTWRAFRRTVEDGRPAKDVADELSMSPGAAHFAKSRGG
jgi:hypothetical protein